MIVMMLLTLILTGLLTLILTGLLTLILTGLLTLLLVKAGHNPSWFVKGDTKFGIIGFHTKNIQKLYDYLKEQNIEVSEISDGVFAYFMKFLDLDNNIFEVIQLKNEVL